MTVLAFGLALVLTTLAALHAYWGFGGMWPGIDLADRGRRVGGFAGASRADDPAACFAVAGALAAAALIALACSAPSGLFSGLAAVAALAVAAVFLGRGIAGYTPAWRRLTPLQPFARYDTRFYSPLCLLVGAGLAVLALQRLIS